MPDKIKKYSRIYKYRNKVKKYLNMLYHEEKLDSVFGKYGISKLPEVSISEILEHYSFKNENNISVVTDFSGGISPVNDYFFLCMIAKAAGVKKYFEFGTWVGLSAYNMAQNLGKEAEIYSLDIPAGHPEISEYKIPAEIFGYYSKNIPNVHFLKSDSKNFNPEPYKKQFDLVFVDGNHSYEYVKNDTRLALELIKENNAVIAWHDYILGGELNKNVLAGILDTIPEGDHKHIFSLYQSNMALYSKAYNFERKYFGKWDIPEMNFIVSTELNAGKHK